MVRSSATVAAYSTDTETLFDTISEPPRCHGKLAEKLKSRSNGGSPAMGRDPDGESNCYEPRTPVEPPEDEKDGDGDDDVDAVKKKSKSSSSSSSLKKSTSLHSKATKKSTSSKTLEGQKSIKSVGGTATLVSANGASTATATTTTAAGKISKKSSASKKTAGAATLTSSSPSPASKSKKSQKASPSSSSTSCASVVSTETSRSRKATYWDGTSTTPSSSGRKTKSAPSATASHSHNRSNANFARTPSRETTRTNATGIGSRISGASKVSNYVVSSPSAGAGELPPSKSAATTTDHRDGASDLPAHRQWALVPAPSGRPAVDPPPAQNNQSSSSTTASCTSSEDSHGNGGESGMAMVQYYGDPPSMYEGQMEVWKGDGGGGDRRQGNDPRDENEEESILEGSDGEEESHSRLDTIQSGSEYSSDEEEDEDEERIYEDEDIEDQDYRDGDTYDDDEAGGTYNDDSERSGSRSASEAASGRELVVADQNNLSRRSSNNSSNQEHQLVVADPKNNSETQALAPYEHPTTSNALTTTANNNANNGAIVPSQPRYLASAVDNNFAMVPLTSDAFEAYDHTFVTCPENLRFRFLYTFLKKNLDKKILVFFSTTNSAKFHGKLLGHFHIPCLTMHGRMKKEQFIKTFFRFSDMDEGILCATDAAGRDLDIPPSVDWVIQFEPPDDPSEYILRVARISCDSDRVGRSLLFLNPGEMGFLKYYHSAAIPVSEFEIPKLADIQTNIEYHVNESESLRKYAKDAYGSYLISYASHGFRDVYNVHDLNKNDVAAAFGLINDMEEEEEEGSGSDRERDGYRGGGSVSRNNNRGSNGMWQSQKKKKEKTWLKSEKTWPHCQVKLHPSFKPGYKKPPPEAGEDE